MNETNEFFKHPHFDPPIIEVGEDKQYKTIAEAVKNAPPRACIMVSPGEYKDEIIIDKEVSIYGCTVDESSKPYGSDVWITGPVKIEMNIDSKRVPEAQTEYELGFWKEPDPDAVIVSFLRVGFKQFGSISISTDEFVHCDFYAYNCLWELQPFLQEEVKTAVELTEFSTARITVDNCLFKKSTVDVLFDLRGKLLGNRTPNVIVQCTFEAGSYKKNGVVVYGINDEAVLDVRQCLVKTPGDFIELRFNGAPKGAIMVNGIDIATEVTGNPLPTIMCIHPYLSSETYENLTIFIDHTFMAGYGTTLSNTTLAETLCLIYMHDGIGTNHLTNKELPTVFVDGFRYDLKVHPKENN